MRNRPLFLLVLSLLVPLCPAEEAPVTPRPAMVKTGAGEWVAGPILRLEAGGPALAPVLLAGASGREVAVVGTGQETDLRWGDLTAAAAGEHRHRLTISPEGILIESTSEEARFHAVQSLVQLLEAARGKDKLALAARVIEDSPRFAWRGFMLDESRHFSGEDAVKRLLDGMARYKMNRFHWHLTDSPGWRIEIKAYPKLTEVGGRGSETDRRPDAPAQFYTQEQIRRLVAYAKERHITIIPEIDMPGHADAAVLAYPEHDGGGFTRPKGTSWPRFTFNPAREETLKFLDTILEETAELFPDAGVIHFGGDEVHFGWHKWPELPEVKELMKREGFTRLEEVETWFNRRMAGTINQLGFRTGGWDEIAARGLPPEKTVVFWWRHDKEAVLRSALDAGYPIVLCPRRPCYFDFVQHDSHKVGRRWGGFNPLEDVYDFPAGLRLSPEDERKVLGIQACLWTETAATRERRDFLTWPRLIALAEAAWTPGARKDHAAFMARLPGQLAWLKENGIGYHDPFANSPEVTDEGEGKPAGHLD